MEMFKLCFLSRYLHLLHLFLCSSDIIYIMRYNLRLLFKKSKLQFIVWCVFFWGGSDNNNKIR